jgi:tripartite-type tricarboxylate transporter receptor subunit TctC
VCGTAQAQSILAKLHGAIVTAMRAPEIDSHLAHEGSAVVANSPDEYRAIIRREPAKWQKIVAAAGIKPL